MTSDNAIDFAVGRLVTGQDAEGRS